MPGRLFLIPNTLDFGVATTSSPALDVVLPHHVIATAARLGFWVAEDARSTRAFLKRVDAVVPLVQPLQAIRIDELPRRQKGNRVGSEAPHAPLLAPALDAGHDMGLISEAGLPAVADPGALLVAAAHASGIEVVPMSGPSSLMLALAASGLNGQSFAFNGYLPIDAAERATRIRDLELQSRRQMQTQLVIETPYRNEALLAALIGTLLPATRLSVSCGLTLDRGWTRTAAVSQWRSQPGSIAKDIPAVFSFLAA